MGPPSNTDLSSLVEEMRDVISIQRGEVSPQAIADRLLFVAPGFAVPRGYLRDNIDPAAAESAWEENCDAPETLAAVAAWCARANDLIPPPPPPPEPDPEAPPPEPEPPHSGPLGVFHAMRRRLAR